MNLSKRQKHILGLICGAIGGHAFIDIIFREPWPLLRGVWWVRTALLAAWLIANGVLWELKERRRDEKEKTP